MKILSILIISFYAFSICAQEANPKLAIEEVKEGFYVFTTYKYFKGKPMSANGMYVLTSEGAVLIDTPWDTTQFQPLLDSIKSKHGQEVVMCIGTHSHEDRIGGLEYYSKKGIKTYTSALTDQISKKYGDPRAVNTFQNDTTFNIGGKTFSTYYPGHGHTIDNLLVWFGQEKILYGGCFVKSTDAKDLGYIGEADLAQWKQSAKQVAKKFKAKYIITGHQSWKNKKALKHTLKLLNHE